MNIDHKYCAPKSCNVYFESVLTLLDEKKRSVIKCRRGIIFMTFVTFSAYYDVMS